MLAICEDCSKKYTIDESKMKSDRARFNCQECGHIIIVEKNQKQGVRSECTPDFMGERK
ncbi:MAG: hypothetical protein CSA33_04045 [Desulfobulbus propionicus]|nr:MAG: hypothetical protein CSA33_04045 [Desulfobulbus propionicus]